MHGDEEERMRRGKHSGVFTEDDYYDEWDDDEDDDYWDEEEDEEEQYGNDEEESGTSTRSGTLVSRVGNATLDVLRPGGQQQQQHGHGQWPRAPHGNNGSSRGGGAGFAHPSPDACATSEKKGEAAFQLVSTKKPATSRLANSRSTTTAAAAKDKRKAGGGVEDAESVAGNVGRMSIGGERHTLAAASAMRPISEFSPDERLLEDLRREAHMSSSSSSDDAAAAAGSGGDVVHVVVMGHVDAGKSTLTGRLLYACGAFSEKHVNQCAHESRQMGHADAQWAFLLDERPEEREHGITVDCAMATLDTSKAQTQHARGSIGRKVQLLDAPGHRDFVPNMIGGASQADAAALVVDGSRGGFESGFQRSGQTREHVRLARCLGVDQLIVIISKMDAVAYARERVHEIQSALQPFLEGCGFKRHSIMWIPVSAMDAENLISAPKNEHFAWYDGPCVIEALNSLRAPERLTRLPFRMPISEVLEKSRALGATAISGRVESGVIKLGSKLMLQPGSHDGVVVKAMTCGGSPVTVAGAGMTVDMGLTGVSDAALFRGAVLSHREFCVPVIATLSMRIIVLDVPMPILQGQALVFHCHVLSEAAHISKLTSLVDPKSGDVKKKAPRMLTRNQHALIELTLERPVCVEKFSDIASLGRAALRDMDVTLAVGIITQVGPPPAALD